MGDETPLMYGSLAEWFHLLTSPDEYAAEAAEVLRLLETHTLRAALVTAFVHLRPLGAAIFMPDWVRDDYRPRTEHGGSDEGERGLRYLEWDGAIEPDGHTVKTDYVIVTRDGDDVTVHHDVHELGVFPRATWRRLLSEVGFEPHRVVGGEGLDIFIGVRPVASGTFEAEQGAGGAR